MYPTLFGKLIYSWVGSENALLGLAKTFDNSPGIESPLSLHFTVHMAGSELVTLL